MTGSKAGSSAVFLCIVLSALISISLAMVYAAHWKAVDSYADGVFDLASDSVLSEFDYYVQKDYGIFLLQGNDKSFSKKMRNYSSYSLDVLDKVSVSKCTASGGRYNVVNVDMITDQIIKYMKTAGIIDDLRTEEHQWSQTDGEETRHTLRHGPTIVSLPSRQFPEKSIIQKAESAASGIKDPTLIFRAGTSKYLLDSYILSHFNCDTVKSADDHFFRNEVEYILSGKLSDNENIKSSDLALKAIRFPTNIAHIYADPEKIAAVTALAETITPGPLGGLTQAGIASAWAAAESINDVKLLHAGYKVPLVKDAASWAIDLDGLAANLESLLKMNTDNYIRPEINKGKNYDDYMRILLFIEDEDIKTARILDLIQINMRRNYDSDFLIQECCTGISVDAEVKGNQHEFDKLY